MNTVMIPNTFQAAMPVYAGGGGSWRPAAHAQLQSVRVHPVARPVESHWRPSPVQLGQVQSAPASLAKGADVLFSLLTAVGAMTVGIAAMTIGIGGEKSAIPGQGKPPSANWRWIGGITASLGVLMVLSNVSKISKISEVVVPTTKATAQLP
jgi:hypothetical protein